MRCRRNSSWLLPWLGLLALMLAIPNGARASNGIDVTEHVFGATNVNAITGHGRLSIGVAGDGDLTLLLWPNPSFGDQLAYLSSNALNARSLPRFGSPDGAGAFFGLLVERSGGAREVTWLHDRDTWRISQSYGPGDGPNPTTAATSAALGLAVMITDAVAPPLVDARDDRADVVVRQVVVERLPESPVAAAWLLSYANLSPVPPESRIPMLPVADWLFDGRNDFAALWVASHEAIIHFHPSDQRLFHEVFDLAVPPQVDFGPVGTALESETVAPATVADLASRLDADYGPGAYLAMTTLPRPDQHHVGFDATPFCDFIDALLDNLVALKNLFPGFAPPVPEEQLQLVRCTRGLLDFHAKRGWLYQAPDALVDAGDGELSGGDIAAGEVNEVLRTPLTFASTGGPDRATAALVIAAAPTAAAALTGLTEVTAPEDVVTAAEAELAAFAEGLVLPEAQSDLVRRVARRALINLRVGTCSANGAVVASLARQPPYGQDWPRDGAFFNVALDVSGQHDLVTERAALYDSWQRTEDATLDPILSPDPFPGPDGEFITGWPAAAWEMSYDADGLPGGVFAFEIDTTALAIWTMVAHAGWLPPEEQASYLESRWASLSAGADLLTAWRDPETGLHAPAQEDDGPDALQTLHGAVPIFGALELASRAARLLGRDGEASTWERRASELRQAILDHFHDDTEGFIQGETARIPFVASGMTPSGPTAWLVWPTPLLPLDDPRIQAQVARDRERLAPVINLETAGGLYYMKSTVAAGVAQLGLPPEERAANQERLFAVVEQLAAQATPDTQHFGEVMVTETPPGGGAPVASQRVATPHLWEGTLFYLTAMAAEDPEALLRHDRALPASKVPFPDAGCGCRATSEGPSHGPLAGILWLLALLRRSGSRRPRCGRALPPSTDARHTL